jgi:predicted TIM-barrel fold metal-dependent hydrolase
MPRVIDKEFNVPKTSAEIPEHLVQLGARTPDRLPPRAGYGDANYGNIFGSLDSESPRHDGGSPGISTAALVAMMDRAGVEKGVLMAPEVTNAKLAEMIREYPDRFIGLAYLSPRDGMGASRELERLVREDGIGGLMVCALDEALPASDRRYYPLYAKCVELDIPIRVYCAMNYANDRPYDLGHPRHLDQIAIDFPELRIVAGLSGWPWVADTVGLLRRHPNLYADTAAHRPKYLGVRGSGWETFLQFGNTLLQDKVMVGLSWALIGDTLENLVDEYMQLPLKESVKDKWLYANAAEFFRLG